MELPTVTTPEKAEKNPIQEEIEVEFQGDNPSPSPPDEAPSYTSKRSLEADQHELILLQQRFYQSENARSAKKHRLEVKNLNLKNQILELELEERRKRLEFTKESTTTVTPS